MAAPFVIGGQFKRSPLGLSLTTKRSALSFKRVVFGTSFSDVALYPCEMAGCVGMVGIWKVFEAGVPTLRRKDSAAVNLPMSKASALCSGVGVIEYIGLIPL